MFKNRKPDHPLTAMAKSIIQDHLEVQRLLQIEWQIVIAGMINGRLKDDKRIGLELDPYGQIRPYVEIDPRWCRPWSTELGAAGIFVTLQFPAMRSVYTIVRKSKSELGELVFANEQTPFSLTDYNGFGLQLYDALLLAAYQSETNRQPSITQRFARWMSGYTP